MVITHGIRKGTMGVSKKVINREYNKVRYHCAGKIYGGVAESIREKDSRIYECNNNYVLQHDICDVDIPDIFYTADAVFVVTAFQYGYKLFIENTIAKGTVFHQYLEGISRALNALKKPSFVICNRHYIKRLKPYRVEEIVFDRFDTNDVCAIWNYDGYVPEHTVDLMRMIGGKYDKILDFCCGYGEIANYAKHFILSDVNTGCLAYVKQHYLYGKG